MNLFSEMIQAVQDDMNVLDEAPLYPLARVKRAINRSYIKCAGLFKWAGTEYAMKTSTQKNLEYYDYPRQFKDDSIFRIEVDDEQYGEDPDGSPMRFEDYLVWRRDSINANSTDKKWATQKRRYFIYPVPTSAGSYNISVWGYRTPDTMTANSDYTIFSYSMPEGNEAVVMEAEAILRAQGEENESSAFRSTEAKQILVVLWNKQRQEQQKYEKIQPFFDVPNYFDSNSSQDVKNRIGNF